VIDPDWLLRIAALADADLGGIEPERLAALLDDPAEVMPFLLTRADGFADWSKGRAALAKAIRAFPRPPRTDPDAPRRKPASPRRSELYDKMRATLVGSDVHWQPDWEERGIHIEELLTLVKSVRFDEERGQDSPGMFISRD